MMRIAVIVGSTRPNRRGPAVTRWVMDEAPWPADVQAHVLDLAEFGLPLLDEPIPPMLAERYQHEHTRRWANAIADADGFLFVTPEYNHGIPAALKNALDFLHDEWNDKAAAFVSYGSTGGVRAVEQLRLAMGELRVADVRAAVSLNLAEDFDQDGAPRPRPFHADVLAETVGQLVSWTAAMAAVRAGDFATRTVGTPTAKVALGGPRSSEEAANWAEKIDVYPDFHAAT